jgi:hypothetical protein
MTQGRAGGSRSRTEAHDMSSGPFVGIDVAKDKRDVAVRPSAEQWVAP